MKALAQIEPRTSIAAAPFTISAPGSYYLTTNLTVSSGDAISIAANGVSLDLNGFTSRSTAASTTGYAIKLNSTLRNITIANGFIEGGVTNNGSSVYSGSGFAYGISYSGSAPVNALVSRVSVAGCLFYGIRLGTADSTVVEVCTVRTVGSWGIYASTIKQSTAIDCGGYAFVGDQVADCRGEFTGSSYGVSANGTAHNGYDYSSSGTGVYAFRTAIGCYGYSVTGTGLHAFIGSSCSGISLGIPHNHNSF